MNLPGFYLECQQDFMKAKTTAPQIGDAEFTFDSVKRRIPRRIVRERDKGEPEVLQTFEGDMTESKLHETARQLAQKHPGSTIALEWQANQGWVRYLTMTPT